MTRWSGHSEHLSLQIKKSAVIGIITVHEGYEQKMNSTVSYYYGSLQPKNIRVIMTKPIHIKKNAWIGARVSILPGVTIGENTIVGTGAVVTKDIPDNSIAVGNPAHVIKTIAVN